MIRQSFLALAFMCAWQAVAAADDGTPQINAEEVREGVHVLYAGNGLGSNIGVIETPEGLVLIDTMRKRSAAKLAAVLSTVSELRVSHVFNTHRHEDHNSGNGSFLKAGAVLVRQKNGPDGDAERQIRFADTLSLRVGGVRVDAYAAASHSSDDALVFVPEKNILFMGDTFSTNWHPSFYAGGEKGQLEAIARAMEVADGDTIIVPGHGAATTIDGVVAYRTAFIAWMEQMRTLDAAGATADEMETDGHLREIAATFLQDGSQSEIRAASYRRFIDRTISTELMKVDATVLPFLANYAGTYRYADGQQVNIRQRGGTLDFFEGEQYSGKIIPLSKERFHFPGRLKGEGYLTFQFGDGGEILSTTYVGGEQSFIAKRISD